MAQVVQGYGYGHEKVDFGGQKVKGQGHTRPKIDLVAWRRHRSQSQPLVSSIFSSYYYRFTFSVAAAVRTALLVPCGTRLSSLLHV